MRQSRTVEVVVGVFVALGLGALLLLALRASNLSEFGNGDGYEVVAYFDNVGGLKPQAPVNIGGVRVGRVTAIGYSQDRYQAVVRMTINPQYDELPADTSAAIYTAGLLGEQYVGLEPGGAEAYLEDGATIRYTQSALALEQIIGRFLYNQAQEGAGDAGAAPAP